MNQMTKISGLGDAAQKFVSRQQKLLIDGQWVDATSGETFDAIDPATEQVICKVASAGKDDVDRAVKAARKAFEGEWSKVRPVQRERLLHKLADLIEQNSEELAQLESLDNGKLLFFARIIDVAHSVDFLRYMAGWATKVSGTTLDVSIATGVPDEEYQCFTLRQPVGVVGQIIPWNFPLVMAAWKLGPALAAGCTVVIKPAEQTPLTAIRLGELIMEAGFPAGVVNIVTGFGKSAGAAIVEHPDIDKIAFTGSTATGKWIGKTAMDSMKRVSLELGGKSPMIVNGDVSPEEAIGGSAAAIFFNSGQVCTAGSRLYVEHSIYDQVVEGLAAAAESVQVGPGLAEGSQLGPLVSQAQLERVLGFIEKGKAEGGKVAAGGVRKGDQGYFVQPTVFTDCGPNNTVVREEIFGPVVVATPFKDVEEIARIANDTNYGLAASIWTKDLSFAHRMARRLRAGTVWVNTHNVVDPNLPFGGFKQSGIGRENGAAAIDLYTESKTVVMKI